MHTINSSLAYVEWILLYSFFVEEFSEKRFWALATWGMWIRWLGLFLLEVLFMLGRDAISSSFRHLANLKFQFLSSVGTKKNFMMWGSRLVELTFSSGCSSYLFASPVYSLMVAGCFLADAEEPQLVSLIFLCVRAVGRMFFAW